MGNVGLLLVVVVLLVNGLVSLGVVPARSAAPLNLFVGSAQVVLPTIVLIQHGSDPAVLNATWPSYLFGFTYLWFGLQILHGLEPQAFGWYSAFVSAIAGYHAVLALGTDPVFAVIWATWAVMWGLFFVLLGLGVSQVRGFDLGRFTGWFLVWLGVPTCTVSALFLLQGRWTTSPGAGLAALAGLLALTAVSVVLTRAGAPRASSAVVATSATDAREDDVVGPVPEVPSRPAPAGPEPELART